MRYLVLFVLTAILFSACKKKSSDSTKMSVSTGNSSWTVSGVTAVKTGNNVTITGYRVETNEKVVLIINNYQPDFRAYLIGDTANASGEYSSAYYTYNNITDTAISGSVDITSAYTNTTLGDFNFIGHTITVHGSFTMISPR